MSEDEGEKGENGTHAAVLLRVGDLVVVGLENPLLVVVVLAGLDSFEVAVEGGEGRYLTPVVEDGVDDIISFPCLVLKGEGDDDDIIVEPEADNGRGLFICCLSFFCFRFVISSVTELCRATGNEAIRTYVFAFDRWCTLSLLRCVLSSLGLASQTSRTFCHFRLSRSQDFLSEGAKFVSSASPI